jgi:uncharacterized membrane protein YeaQ/YmgE (transglycosylase-associated protein family)
MFSKVMLVIAAIIMAALSGILTYEYFKKQDQDDVLKGILFGVIAFIGIHFLFKVWFVSFLAYCILLTYCVTKGKGDTNHK